MFHVLVVGFCGIDAIVCLNESQRHMTLPQETDYVESQAESNPRKDALFDKQFWKLNKKGYGREKDVHL